MIVTRGEDLADSMKDYVCGLIKSRRGDFDMETWIGGAKGALYNLIEVLILSGVTEKGEHSFDFGHPTISNRTIYPNTIKIKFSIDKQQFLVYNIYVIN